MNAAVSEMQSMDEICAVCGQLLTWAGVRIRTPGRVIAAGIFAISA